MAPLYLQSPLSGVFSVESHLFSSCSLTEGHLGGEALLGRHYLSLNRSQSCFFAMQIKDYIYTNCSTAFIHQSGFLSSY